VVIRRDSLSVAFRTAAYLHVAGLGSSRPCARDGEARLRCAVPVIAAVTGTGQLVWLDCSKFSVPAAFVGRFG
jgi:hypothetical protein